MSEAMLCEPGNLQDLLHQGYIAACEAENPGLVNRTVKAVSGEIRDMIAYRYPQPWPCVPDLIRYIAAVLSAYRVVQAITSIVDTEGATANEWIPLQTQSRRCHEMLKDIASGKLKLNLGAEEATADREDAGIAVITDGAFFDFRGF